MGRFAEHDPPRGIGDGILGDADRHVRVARCGDEGFVSGQVQGNRSFRIREGASEPTDELVQKMVVAGPTQGGTATVAPTGCALLDGRRTGRAAHPGHQFDRILSAHRGPLVPGTVVKITLQSSTEGDGAASGDRSAIAVQSRVVRRGTDGVGLEFILPGALDRDSDFSQRNLVSDRKDLDRFLERLGQSGTEMLIDVE